MPTTIRRVVDVGPLIDAARDLDSFDVGSELASFVSEKAGQFADRTLKGMVRNIALSEGYVKSKMTVEAATKQRLRAVITTEGSLVVLGHYNPRVTTRPAVRRGNRTSKGDASRGVPPGQVASGVRVTVKPGSPKELPGAFTMRLRRGTDQGDTLGVFTRQGGKLLHRYGVAPYSLFRFQINEQQDAFVAEFNDELADRIVDKYGRTVA